MSAKLTGNDLTVIRGERCIFRDQAFSLESGELLVLNGRNGSGKTSLLRAIAGMLSLESGIVEWNGKSIAEIRQEYHGSLVWLAHRTGLKRDLTLAENLAFECALRPQSRTDAAAVYERLDIGRLKRVPVSALSAGQQRRAALARMLMADVPLWLMDEPFTNLDRDGRRLVMQLIEEHLKNDGLCIIAAHQDVTVAANTKTVSL